jgi:glycosyltransferase involved in cell wall biosynthesis
MINNAGMLLQEPVQVSVIVPARNEEACLGTCLQSLVAQEGVQFEVMVVDDGSRDRTSEIARSFAGVKVIQAGPLPAGWAGKNNAMAAGAKVAKGKWLLFTDADTFHKPASLARAVGEAEAHGAALLSYSPEQEVHGLLEKAVMPVIFAELAAAFPTREVSDLASPVAAANGQYLMISREAYDAVGGHTTIASDLLEDVAMARLVKTSGRKIFFRYGGDAVRTRMYRSWTQMQEGWTKNLALLFPQARELALARAVEWVAIFAGLGVGIIALSVKQFGVAWIALGVGMATAARTWVRMRGANFSWDANLAAFAGLAIFSYLLFRSASMQRDGVNWKGRTYKPASR